MPRILFITPIDPSRNDNGLALRAGYLQSALELHGQVEVVVVPVSAGLAGNDSERDAAASGQHHAAAWLSNSRTRTILQQNAVLPARCRLASPAVGEQLLKQYGGEPFDLVYVFRTYLAGVVAPLLDAWPDCHFVLDIDENDADVLAQIADLRAADGNHCAAEAIKREAGNVARFSDQVMAWFDSLVCSSEVESNKLRLADQPRQETPAVFVVRNVYPGEISDTAVRPAQNLKDPALFSILLIGNLGYWPNVDAARWLVSTIFPAIQQQLPQARLDLVGRGDPGEVAVTSVDAVRFHGFVQDLTQVFGEASVCMVPLRAGGGSRLKILEAFVRGVPVVATPKAAEGLQVMHGEHLLLAETTEDYVRHSLFLVKEPEHALRLARAARDWVRATHAPARLREDMGRVLEYAGL